MRTIWRAFRRGATVIEVGVALVAIALGLAGVVAGRAEGWWLMASGAVLLLIAAGERFARPS
jgi:hypothetical protein